MLDNNDELLERDLENNNSKDEEVQINVSHKKKRFDTFRMKYKKDKKKYMVIMVAMLIMLSTVVGTSYAYLRGISKTNNSVVISAGTIALTLQNDENVLDISNAVPMSDEDGLAQSTEYSFDVKNNGTIPAVYTITLDNTCEAGNGIDLCIPDQYIKVGIKTGNEEYKVLEKKDQEKYIIETGELQKGKKQTYKMKIWLDYNTPNTYNAVNNQVIAYKGKLGLTYKQGKDDGSKTIFHSSLKQLSIGDSIVSEEHQGYCAYGTSGSTTVNSCNLGIGFDTETECQNYISESEMGNEFSCQTGTWTSGLDNYTEDYTTLNKNIFLKFTINASKIITSQEVCYIINNNLYCLIGGDGGESYSTNKNTLNTSLGVTNCNETDSTFISGTSGTSEEILRYRCQTDNPNSIGIARNDGEVSFTDNLSFGCAVARITAEKTVAGCENLE